MSWDQNEDDIRHRNGIGFSTVKMHQTILIFNIRHQFLNLWQSTSLQNYRLVHSFNGKTFHVTYEISSVICWLASQNFLFFSTHESVPMKRSDLISTTGNFFLWCLKCKNQLWKPSWHSIRLVRERSRVLLALEM